MITLVLGVVVGLLVILAVSKAAAERTPMDGKPSD